jgi:hypothetical protein
MGGMWENQDEQTLREIVANTRALIIETRASRKEWLDLQQEVEDAFARGVMTGLSHAIHKEHLRRSGQDIDCCMRSLERQMKAALQKLYGLDKA